MPMTAENPRLSALKKELHADPYIYFTDMRDAPKTQEEARKRLVAVRDALGWNNVRLGEYFGGVTRATVYTWVHGRSPVPSHVQDALPFLEAFAEQQAEHERQERKGQLLAAGFLVGSVMIYEWLRGNDA